jgi:hypothetical protein
LEFNGPTKRVSWGWGGINGDWWRFIGENSWDSWGFLLINKDSWGLMNGGYWWLYVAMASA